jgi:hypothetical protein
MQSAASLTQLFAVSLNAKNMATGVWLFGVNYLGRFASIMMAG